MRYALILLLLLTVLACAKESENIDVDEISIFEDNTITSGNVLSEDSTATGDLFGGEAAKSGNAFTED